MVSLLLPKESAKSICDMRKDKFLMQITKILQNIFSITNNDNNTVIRFLGLKIEHRVNNKLYWSAYNEWFSNGSTDHLLKICKNIEEKRNVWAKIRNEFWLFYISALCEKKQFENAEKILKKYVQIYGYKDIHRYLLTAKFATKSNFLNENIEKAALVFDKLENNRRSNLFEKFIKGKTVAIVGNGPSEIGKNKGKEIDAHDIVIRFNNYKIEGFEKDYGERTDIWIKCSSDDIKHKIRDKKIKLIVYEPDYLHHPVIDGYLDALFESPVDIDYFDFEAHSELRQNLNIFPSSGLVAINKVNNSLKKKMDCYGFSFLQDIKEGYSSHYFNDRSVKESIKRSSNHNLNKESEFLQKLIGGGK